MTIKTLYRYNRENGGVTVSIEQPAVNYTECYRIIADDGKMVTLDGIDLRSVVDVDNTDGWYEVDAPLESFIDKSAEYEAALAEIEAALGTK